MGSSCEPLAPTGENTRAVVVALMAMSAAVTLASVYGATFLAAAEINEMRSYRARRNVCGDDMPHRVELHVAR